MENVVLMQNKYGQKIWADPSEIIGDAILKKGIYDEHAIHCIQKILTKMAEPIVLDIGAHMGNHALVMTQFSKMVYCFDPLPANVDLLHRNKNENQIQNMQVFPYGLSDQEQTLPFFKDAYTFVPDLQEGISPTNVLVCKVGDDLLKEHHINKVDFIKIDIEGFEARALYGLKHTIQTSRPVVMMEWNNDHTREGFKQYDLFNTVFENYKILAMTHNHHKAYWGNQWYSQLLRFLYRKFVPKRKVLAHFVPEVRYTNILLLPKEKDWATILR